MLVKNDPGTLSSRLPSNALPSAVDAAAGSWLTPLFVLGALVAFNPSPPPLDSRETVARNFLVRLIPGLAAGSAVIASDTGASSTRFNAQAGRPEITDSTQPRPSRVTHRPDDGFSSAFRVSRPQRHGGGV